MGTGITQVSFLYPHGMSIINMGRITKHHLIAFWITFKIGLQSGLLTPSTPPANIQDPLDTTEPPPGLPTSLAPYTVPQTETNMTPYGINPVTLLPVQNLPHYAPSPSSDPEGPK